MAEPTTQESQKEAAVGTKKPKSKNGRVITITIIFVLVVGGAIAGGAYWLSSRNHVSIEDSMISAPEIDLAPTTSGVLEEVDVHEGDTIGPNTVVARVGDELVQSTVGGLVISVQNEIGTTFAPGQTVVTMIDPSQLRVVGQLDENKGLSSVQVGDPVTFTVDAFGSKTYYGTVDEIAPTALSTSVVFNISDQRPTQEFNIYVRFDVDAYPELKNGMSAKMDINTQ